MEVLIRFFFKIQNNPITCNIVSYEKSIKFFITLLHIFCKFAMQIIWFLFLHSSGHFIWSDPKWSELTQSYSAHIGNENWWIYSVATHWKFTAAAFLLLATALLKLTRTTLRQHVSLLAFYGSTKGIGPFKQEFSTLWEDSTQLNIYMTTN